MGREFSIASVTVAYNAARVIRGHLDSLRQQSRKLDEMVVVDNASTDETHRLLASEYPEVTVLKLPENGGVGGGLAAGLAYAALKKKHDWVWLFDQDSIASEDGLEQLLDGILHLGDSLENIAILAPVCVHQETQLGYTGLIWRNGLRAASLDFANKRISFVDSVISSGTLLRRQAIEKVGLPRADFFMDFVDHEYCLRLRRHGYKIAVVTRSRLDHAIGDPRKVSLFGFPRAWACHAPSREYYMTRNEVFTIWNYYPDWRTKTRVGHRLVRHAVAILLFGKRRLACLGMMYRGFVDGRAGRLGTRSFDNSSTT